MIRLMLASLLLELGVNPLLFDLSWMQRWALCTRQVIPNRLGMVKSPLADTVGSRRFQPNGIMRAEGKEDDSDGVAQSRRSPTTRTGCWAPFISSIRSSRFS